MSFIAQEGYNALHSNNRINNAPYVGTSHRVGDAFRAWQKDGMKSATAVASEIALQRRESAIATSQMGDAGRRMVESQRSGTEYPWETALAMVEVIATKQILEQQDTKELNTIAVA